MFGDCSGELGFRLEKIRSKLEEGKGKFIRAIIYYRRSNRNEFYSRLFLEFS